jgi:hypothetical protein
MAVIYTAFKDPKRLTPGQREEAQWRERNLYNVANQLSQAALQQSAVDNYLDQVEGRELVKKYGAVGDEASRFATEVMPGIAEKVAEIDVPDLAGALWDAAWEPSTGASIKRTLKGPSTYPLRSTFDSPKTHPARSTFDPPPAYPLRSTFDPRYARQDALEFGTTFTPEQRLAQLKQRLRDPIYAYDPRDSSLYEDERKRILAAIASIQAGTPPGWSE